MHVYICACVCLLLGVSLHGLIGVCIGMGVCVCTGTSRVGSLIIKTTHIELPLVEERRLPTPLPPQRSSKGLDTMTVQAPRA